MRCYFFTNMYMLGIQAGIQSQHSGQRLCNKYGMGFYGEQNLNAVGQYNLWARDHETSIVVNAGYQSNMMRLLNLLKTSHDTNQVAWAEFHEEQDALNGALTSIAVVLEERIYLSARDYGRYIEQLFSLDEKGFVIANTHDGTPYGTNKSLSVTDTVYLHYDFETMKVLVQKASLAGGMPVVQESLSMYEVGIILFMHRLRLAS